MKINGLEQNFFLLGKVSEFISKDLLKYLDEILDRKILLNEFEKNVLDEPEFETKKFNNIFDFRFYRILLYCIIRDQKPKTIIETGNKIESETTPEGVVLRWQVSRSCCNCSFCLPLTDICNKLPQ